MSIRFLIFLLVVAWVRSLSFASETASVNGATIYAESCALCHGDRGQGEPNEYAAPLQGDLSVEGLIRLISKTMPKGDPESCAGDDAEAVAAWMHREFYNEAAGSKHVAPRKRLARLTADQLRQSLADLYASQDGVVRNVEGRGLMARYFNDTSLSDDKQVFERTDPNINFDFGHDGPGQGVTADNFSVSWRGGLRADRTGQYEFVVRSSCAFDMRLGKYQRKFIDNNTQSGDKTEFRQSVTLTGCSKGRLRDWVKCISVVIS